MLGALVALVALPALPSPASASSDQRALFDMPSDQLFGRTTEVLQAMRDLGVKIIKVSMEWDAIAPWSQLRLRPPLFNASNPADYPRANWAPYDKVVAEAPKYGIQVAFTLGGGAPLWATSPGAPAGYWWVWDPSPGDYRQFVQAVGRRYPSVHIWELWNEPNWGSDLAPQANAQADIVSAGEYRALLNAGWRGLQRSGHGADTIIAAGLSPDQAGRVSATSTTGPLNFIRTLYCVNGSYRELRGATAEAVGCPTTAAASRRFRAGNPALFDMSGFGVHPYSAAAPPTKEAWGNPNSLEFVGIPRLIKALHRFDRLYGSHKQMAIYPTEYGYQTAPPQPPAPWFVTPATASVYMNWGEYLSWRNPRVETYAQYELADHGWFTSGLVFANGRPKPSFWAYLMPLFLPRNTARKGHAVEVWGGVRPAANARQDTGRQQSVSIQFRRSPQGRFRTIRTVSITDPSGYFDVRVKFPASGAVRLAWAYPAGDPRLQDVLDPANRWIHSRTADITVRG